MATRYYAHGVTGETLPEDVEASETAVLEWLGRIKLRQDRVRHFRNLLRSGLSYEHQGGDPA